MDKVADQMEVKSRKVMEQITTDYGVIFYRVTLGQGWGGTLAITSGFEHNVSESRWPHEVASEFKTGHPRRA